MCPRIATFRRITTRVQLPAVVTTEVGSWPLWPKDSISFCFGSNGPETQNTHLCACESVVIYLPTRTTAEHRLCCATDSLIRAVPRDLNIGGMRMLKTFSSAFVVVAMLVCNVAMAQDCGCAGGAISGGAFGAPAAAGGFGNLGIFQSAHDSNCGRKIGNSQAAALWSGYCTENCGYNGPSGGCSFLGGLKGGHGGCGGGGGCSSGIGVGAFGYPAASGCGALAGGGFGHRHRCGLRKSGGCGLRKAGGCGGGLHGPLKAKGGCGLFSKICRKKSQQSSFVYVDSFASSGCGECGGYFDYAVGAEYGTEGFQSDFAGSVTSCCGGCGG